MLYKMNHTKLPSWYKEYKEHLEYYNEGFIGKKESMSITFIPKNNIYTVGDHLKIMNLLKQKIKNYNYDIKLLAICEGGFQLTHKNYHDSENYEMQIRSNLNSPDVNEFPNKDPNEKIDLFFGTEQGKHGIKLFEFKGYHNVPRKIMLYLYQILETEIDALIFKTEGFPDLRDMIIWGTDSPWVNPILREPKKIILNHDKLNDLLNS